MNYQSRLAQWQTALTDLKCHALLISNLTNVRYATGFTGTAGMVLVLPDKAIFITDFRYKTQAAQQVPNIYQVVIGEAGLWQQACDLLLENFKRRRNIQIGIEGEHVSVAAFDELKEKLKSLTPISTVKVVENSRINKEADELKILRRAIKVADEAFDYICGFLKPGLTETEVADEIERAVKARGATGTSFDTIIASGHRTALPHGVASKKKLAKNDLITIDMGALVDGYCSDMTRTLCLGKATQKQKEIYEVVYRAQTTACAAFKPELDCVAADKIARDIIEGAGYGEYFGHGLGHGVGLNIHENPRLSRLGQGNLAAGMVITCEPGIYIEGVGGVRIEDMLLVTDNGAQILTKSPKPETVLEL